MIKSLAGFITKTKRGFLFSQEACTVLIFHRLISLPSGLVNVSGCPSARNLATSCYNRYPSVLRFVLSWLLLLCKNIFDQKLHGRGSGMTRTLGLVSA